jgi:hypothetical protein
MNTTQTDNGKKQETAKEILDHYFSYPRSADFEKHVLKFAKEIADKAWEAGQNRADDEFSVCLEQKKATKMPDKSTFMKELFPEDNKDTSASG